MPALIGVTLALTLISRLVAGHAAGPLFGLDQLSAAIGFLLIYGLAFLCLMLGQLLLRAPALVRERDGHLDIGHLWANLHKPGAIGILVLLVAGYGISASGNLVEVYRQGWEASGDAILWSIESPLFVLLLGSPLDLPGFWDTIYQSMWLGVLAALVSTSIGDRMPRFVVSMTAIVVAFHLTRYAGIAFPNAGPVFYRPDLFDVGGTASALQAEVLASYMRGEIPQLGLLPGTQGMPSLHVGLAWLAMWTLAREWRWTLWLTIPWFLLNWASTIFLGWHYALDGVGGIAVMAASMTSMARLDALIRRLSGPGDAAWAAITPRTGRADLTRRYATTAIRPSSRPASGRVAASRAGCSRPGA